MAVQNLVSASITPETKTQILTALAGVRAKLDFLLTLQAKESASLVKAGKELQPFISECAAVAKQHPEILPGVFDVTEFERDVALARDLGEIADALGQLHEGLSHTLTAARSDCLVESFDVYGAVKANRSKVVGLGAVADSMGRYFPRSRKATSESAAR